MFERFTERARQVIVFAQEEARVNRHSNITTEHILGGLLREEEGLAARVLESLDLTIERVREAYEGLPESEQEEHGQIPFTAKAKRDLELALREALSMGHNYIGTEHILLGVLRGNPDSLARWELGAEQVRGEVFKILSGPGPQPYPAYVVVRKNGVDAPEPRSIAACVVNAPNHVTAAKAVALAENWYEVALVVVNLADATAMTKTVHRTITVEDAA